MYTVRITLEDEAFKEYKYQDKEQMIQDVLYGDLYIFNQLPFKLRIYHCINDKEVPVMLRLR